MEIKAKIIDVVQTTPFNVNITLQTRQNASVIQNLINLKGSEKNIKITDLRRTLNQNSLLWKLVGEISLVLNEDKETIYKSYIQHYGKFVDYEIINEAIPTITGCWENNGTGWVTEIVDKGEEKSIVRLYYGSSCYGKKRFSMLLDAVKNDCEALGIPTEWSD